MLLNRSLELQLQEIRQGDESSIREALAAEIYATLGEKDEAIAHIRKAVAKGDREYSWYLLDPMFENIHDDARFIEIIDDLKAKVAEMRKKVDAMDNL